MNADIKAQKHKEKKWKLPDGWHWVKLGEVCSVVSKGTTPTSLGFSYTSEGVPFLRAEDVNGKAVNDTQVSFHISHETDEALVRSRLLPGDFLITIAGTLGRVGYLAKNAPQMNCNQAVAFARPKKEIIDVEYIVFVCQHRDVISPLIDLKAGGALQNLNLQQIRGLKIPLPPISEQRRITKLLSEKMAAVEKARAAAQTRFEAVKSLPAAFVRQTLANGKKNRYRLEDCLVEVKNGVGETWSKYPVLGATRKGLAPAKEPVGKAPERYKLVDPLTVFYNPMRILLGSIALVDNNDEAGITSPDYVVVKGRTGVLDTRWFYYWFRSTDGAHLIDSLSRGAVRERILFNRLAAGEIEIPDYETQLHASSQMEHIRPVVETITKEIEAINALPHALLRRAFNGEI